MERCLRYSIITPTVLRQSLLRACESVNKQTCKDWEHIVLLDCEISNDLITKIAHPQRTILRCATPHKNYGHTCRHNAWELAKGEYLYYLDDDNYLAHDGVLEELKVVTDKWAIFPILRHGELFFNDPPELNKTDTGSMLVHHDLGSWPDMSDYGTDGIYVGQLLERCPKYQALKDLQPVMVMPESNYGSMNHLVAEVSAKPRVSIFTPTHTNLFLMDAYNSIKDQDFYEWIIVYNNGGIPVKFDDPRVKEHVLYRAPEKIGTLKSYACQQATGDVLLELDSDDMLAPDAIEEVQKVFTDPKIDFAYSNCIHVTADLKPQPKFAESFGWKYRKAEFQGRALEELVSFPPTPEAVSRVWFGPDHLRSFRRSTYNLVGGHDQSMKVLDDSDLVCRMYIDGNFKHIDKPLYVYRVHGNNSWLVHNKEIQDNVYGVYDKYIERLTERWAKINNLPMIELGNPSALREGYSAQSFNSETHLHLADSSVGIIRATDYFAMLKNPIDVMREVQRVLVPGGWLFCQVPSTDGRGAFQDPRHCSFWNENSFLYYTDRRWAQYIGTPVRFQATRLYTTEKNAQQVCWSIAHLVNLKDGYRPAGEIKI